MRAGQRLLLILLAAALAGAAAGCFGGSQNPSYFPDLVPFGDVIPTHAKPPGPSYYRNFDPKAVKLVVERLESTSVVGTQHVLLGTVYDDQNQPRRGRRVEWMLDGTGSIVEVDESGALPGRGYKTSNRHAVSYTDYHEHRISRGSTNTADDFMVRPGQSWAVFSSPVEGDSYVTVYAPGIYDWEKRVVHAVIHWVDVTWELPPPAVAKFNAPHEFVTKVFKFSDRKPLEGYAVRYRILDGPPAAFVPSGTQEVTVTSNLSGIAAAKIAQTTAGAGTNRVSVEIIRPPDPTRPSGAGIVIVRGDTSVEWLAPDVSLTHTGPATAALNGEVVFTSTATNNGKIESDFLTLKLPVPEGLEYVRSAPTANPVDGVLVYTFGKLPVGQAHTAQTTFRPKRVGPVRSVALLETAEGQKDQKEATTTITNPGLELTLDAPAAAVVGTPFTARIQLRNPGSGPTENVFLVAQLPDGLEHESKSLTVNKTAAALNAGDAREETLVLTPRRPGPLTFKVTATASGLTKAATHTVTAAQPQVSLKIQGPAKRVVGRPAEYTIEVANPGDAPLTNVVVRDRLPPELEFAAAPEGGAFQNGEVVWNVGPLDRGQRRTLNLVLKAVRAAPAAEQVATVTADGDLRREDKAATEIAGIAGIDLALTDLEDVIEVGKLVRYRLDVINNGSAPLNRIEVKATAPAELTPAKATGPTPETIGGRVVTFAPVSSLAPGAKTSFFIECLAEKQGDVRFRVEVTSEANATPLLREEPTRVIAPFAGPAAPAVNPPLNPAPPGNGPPAPPGGGTPMPLPPG